MEQWSFRAMEQWGNGALSTSHRGVSCLSLRLLPNVVAPRVNILGLNLTFPNSLNVSLSTTQCCTNYIITSIYLEIQKCKLQMSTCPCDLVRYCPVLVAPRAQISLHSSLGKLPAIIRPVMGKLSLPSSTQTTERTPALRLQSVFNFCLDTNTDIF